MTRRDGLVAGIAVAAGAAGERFTVGFRVAGGSWRREPLSWCHGTRFEGALPARPFRFGKGLQSFAGWWYFATTRTHVGFESWLERDHLMLMDFDPDVVAALGQCYRAASTSRRGLFRFLVQRRLTSGVAWETWEKEDAESVLGKG